MSAPLVAMLCIVVYRIISMLSISIWFKVWCW